MLEIFNELQFIEAKDILGKITGMAERKRAPKSIMRREKLVVFEYICSLSCLFYFIFCLQRRQGQICFWPGGEILELYYLSP
jgi:hypothetical protein